jgi:hypothetical protein
MIKVLTSAGDYKFDSSNHYIRNVDGALEVVKWEFHEYGPFGETFPIETIVFSTQNYIIATNDEKELCIES